MVRAVNFALAFLFLAAAFTASIDARKTSSRVHTYPSHSGHSGHSQPHSYPPSSGGSGTHTHGSGSTSHGYPSSQGGLSGTGSQHVPHQQAHAPSVQAGVHGQANGHSYPPSPGMSGNNNAGASNVHYHQHVYQAPQQIHYTPVHGSPPAQPYPIYHGQPPVYVHEFRDSGSRYSTLLTGLALYNLGRSSSSHHHYDQSQSQAQQADGERCTLRIEQDRNLEKVKIPCYIVSTFSDANDLKSAASTPQPAPSTTMAPPTTTTTVVPPSSDHIADNATASTNVTLATNATAVQANDTLVTEKLNSTIAAQNATAVAQNTVLTQNATATPHNDTVKHSVSEAVDARQVKGEPVVLSKEARCFVERVTKTRSSVKEIECGLLQQYALQSMQQQQQHQHRKSIAADFKGSLFTLLTASIFAYVVC